MTSLVGTLWLCYREQSRPALNRTQPLRSGRLANRVCPAQAGKAPEISVGRADFATVLDRQRCEVCVHGEVTGRPGGLQQPAKKIQMAFGWLQKDSAGLRTVCDRKRIAYWFAILTGPENVAPDTDLRSMTTQAPRRGSSWSFSIWGIMSNTWLRIVSSFST